MGLTPLHSNAQMQKMHCKLQIRLAHIPVLRIYAGTGAIFESGRLKRWVDASISVQGWPSTDVLRHPCFMQSRPYA